MADARAWLLDWPLQPLALAACEVIEIIDSPQIHSTPFGPSWCRGLILWRDKLLPLALPEHVLHDGDTETHDAFTEFSVVVVAFQTAPQEPLQYAAFPVVEKPSQFAITAGTDCDLPERGVLNDETVRACFRLSERIVIVPELAVLFGKGLRSAA